MPTLIQPLRLNSVVAGRPGSKPCLPQEPTALQDSLRHGLRLLKASESFAAPFQRDDLGEIELPPVAASAGDQANLRTLAALYFASELEAAEILPATETLAGLLVSNAFTTDFGAAAEALIHFWRERRDHLSAQERQAFFAHLFGAGSGPPLAGGRAPNSEFYDHMIGLTEMLYRLGSDGMSDSVPAGIARLQAAARLVAANLLPRSIGVVTFVANDLLESTQRAISILKQRSVQAAVGAGSWWAAVSNIAKRYLDTEPDVRSHVTRAQAGLVILAWLADALPTLDSTDSALRRPAESVINSAASWLEVSLVLEGGSPAPTSG